MSIRIVHSILPAAALLASPHAATINHVGNPPAQALDGNLTTRWSPQGTGQWLQLELPHPLPLDEILIASYLGDTRLTLFDPAVSTDASSWEQVFTGQSSGSSTNLATLHFPSRNAGYHRILSSHDLSPGAWLPLAGGEVIPGDNLDHPSNLADPPSGHQFFRVQTWLESSLIP